MVQSRKKIDNSFLVNELELLFDKNVREIYHVEKELILLFPIIAQSCSSASLHLLFREKTEEKKKHLEKLESVIKYKSIKRIKKSNKAISILIKDVNSIIEDAQATANTDLQILQLSSKIHMYELSLYKSITKLAKVLNLVEIHQILSDILSEKPIGFLDNIPSEILQEKRI